MPAWTPSAMYKLEARSRQRLLRERWLRWHVFCIAVLTLLGLMLIGMLMRGLGIESLAVRYALTLPLAYLVYLGLLRWRAGRLARNQTPEFDADGLELGVDLAQLKGRTASELAGGMRPPMPWRTGGGGDFGGAGAQASFDVDAAGGAALGHGAGEGAGAAAGLLGEGWVLLPLLVAGLLASCLGLAVLALFGVEVLLAVAVELMLAAVAGSLAYQRLRQGWLPRALALTWRGALGMLVLGVALGAAVDHWLPEADSLLQALRLLR